MLDNSCWVVACTSKMFRCVIDFNIFLFFLVFRLKMATNPWNVPDASFFLKYSCPECDFQITHLNIFEVHATTQHELSSILFENIENNKNNDHKSFQEPFQD